MSSNESIEELQAKVQQLTKENRSLKAQLQIEIEKESLHQLTLAKIKQIHSEYETSYLSSISDYKSREANLKNQYFQYQTMLENQFNQSEKRLNEQIIQLKGTIKSKDETIAQITKQNIELKQLISKNEIEWHLKENEYENMLKVKDRKIQELEDSIKAITQSTSDDITKLSSQLNALIQSKNRNVNIEDNDDYGLQEGNDGQNQEEINNDTIHTLDSSPYKTENNQNINMNYNINNNQDYLDHYTPNYYSQA